MRDVCADFEAELVEFNGENTHVHLLVNFPLRTVQVLQLMAALMVMLLTAPAQTRPPAGAGPLPAAAGQAAPSPAPPVSGCP